MHDTGVRECRVRWRSGSCISAGPVAQLSPMTSTPRGSIEESAAAISVPGSIRPVSSIVTWAWIGVSLPTAAIARRHPLTAARSESRSNMVSTMNRSTPPSSSPVASTS